MRILKEMAISVLTFLMVVTLYSCQGRENYTPDSPKEKIVEVYATYTNSSGVPALTLDRSRLPNIVQISSNQSPTEGNNCQPTRVCLSLTNVRFKENDEAYELTKSETYEQSGNGFRLDVENFLKTEKSRTLDYVLVLDISSSLGDDQAKVKDYAKVFIDEISKSSTNSRIGIIIFSDIIQSLPLTYDFTFAKAFFDNKMGKDETKLYEAIDNGFELLKNSSADGKAIVTFTDGINNSWSDPQKYQNINYVLNRLKLPINGGFVSSFTIGLIGKTPTGIDKNSLKQLAVNGGISAIAENSGTLATIFKKFGNSVSAVYSLTYDRNNSRLLTPISLKFVLTIKKLE